MFRIKIIKTNSICLTPLNHPPESEYHQSSCDDDDDDDDFFCFNLPRPHCLDVSGCFCEGVFWMRLTFKLVDFVKQIALHNVGRPHPSSESLTKTKTDLLEARNSAPRLQVLPESQPASLPR